jgi:hypothetical protein
MFPQIASRQLFAVDLSYSKFYFIRVLGQDCKHKRSCPFVFSRFKCDFEKTKNIYIGKDTKKRSHSSIFYFKRHIVIFTTPPRLPPTRRPLGCDTSRVTIACKAIPLRIATKKSLLTDLFSPIGLL